MIHQPVCDFMLNHISSYLLYSVCQGIWLSFMHFFSHSYPPTVLWTHHISCECCIIFTPAVSPAPTRLFSDVFVAPHWHCDHGCHTTHALSSKTAEDSLAHVTTASRLTCYHGNKPANENSADSCNVDCKLFCFKGWPIFPSPLQLLRPCYSGTCARAHSHR